MLQPQSQPQAKQYNTAAAAGRPQASCIATSPAAAAAACSTASPPLAAAAAGPSAGVMAYCCCTACAVASSLPTSPSSPATVPGGSQGASTGQSERSVAGSRACPGSRCTRHRSQPAARLSQQQGSSWAGDRVALTRAALLRHVCRQGVPLRLDPFQLLQKLPPATRPPGCTRQWQRSGKASSRQGVWRSNDGGMHGPAHPRLGCPPALSTAEQHRCCSAGCWAGAPSAPVGHFVGQPVEHELVRVLLCRQLAAQRRKLLQRHQRNLRRQSRRGARAGSEAGGGRHSAAGEAAAEPPAMRDGAQRLVASW